MGGGNQFEAIFGRSPEVRAVSPGRINLIGEHVDYLDGEVMPIAIDRHLTIDAARSDSGRCEIFPVGLGLSVPAGISLDDLSVRKTGEDFWLNYIIGVLAMYQEVGVEVPSFQATIRTTLPTGAGLSSSAALETAIALLIEQLTGIEKDVVDRALLCQQAEHRYAGVPCGIMDQMAVGAGVAGQVLKLDCRDFSWQTYALPDGIAILTADTGVSHALGDGEYRKRRQSCEKALSILGAESFRDLSLKEIQVQEKALGEILFRRSRHAVSEMARVTAFAKALEQENLEALGSAMRQSHESLRDDFEVSCEELDALVDAAYAIGAEGGLLGSRMTGGGFGGSTVSLVRADSAELVKSHLEKFYREKFGRELNCFITAAVDGAHVSSIN